MIVSDQHKNERVDHLCQDQCGEHAEDQMQSPVPEQLIDHWQDEKFNDHGDEADNHVDATGIEQIVHEQRRKQRRDFVAVEYELVLRQIGYVHKDPNDDGEADDHALCFIRALQRVGDQQRGHEGDEEDRSHIDGIAVFADNHLQIDGSEDLRQHHERAECKVEPAVADQTSGAVQQQNHHQDEGQFEKAKCVGVRHSMDC